MLKVVCLMSYMTVTWYCTIGGTTVSLPMFVWQQRIRWVILEVFFAFLARIYITLRQFTTTPAKRAIKEQKLNFFGVLGWPRAWAQGPLGLSFHCAGRSHAQCSEGICQGVRGLGSYKCPLRAQGPRDPGTQGPYEFYRDCGHHAQKSYEFIWRLSKMIRIPMILRSQHMFLLPYVVLPALRKRLFTRSTRSAIKRWFWNTQGFLWTYLGVLCVHT